MQEILSKFGDGILCPCALFFKEKRVLMGLRNYTLEKWKDISVWTLPGGRSEGGETIGETLRREVFEETGISNFEIKEFLGEFPGAKEGDVCLLFLCETIQNEKLAEPEKFSGWKWFLPDNLPTNFINEPVMGFIRSYLGSR